MAELNGRVTANAMDSQGQVDQPTQALKNDVGGRMTKALSTKERYRLLLHVCYYINVKSFHCKC